MLATERFLLGCARRDAAHGVPRHGTGAGTDVPHAAVEAERTMMFALFSYSSPPSFCCERLAQLRLVALLLRGDLPDA